MQSQLQLRPMLAATVKPEGLDALIYPMRMQIKYDGIRAIGHQGELVSRTLKRIRNRHIQNWYKVACELYPWMDACDGELIVGEPPDPQCYHNTNSGVMSADGTPNFSYYLFDNHTNERHYIFRRQWLETKFVGREHGRRLSTGEAGSKVALASEWEVHSGAEVEARYAALLAEGHEGAILRATDRAYKYGRSTLREAGMLKLKSFADAEGIIIGYEELYRNGNEATKDARGYTARTSHQGNLRPAGILGKLQIKSAGFTDDFGIGTGFDEQTRISLWAARDTLVGRLVKFKYMPIGVKDRPRHPVWLGFRDPSDV